MADEILLRDQNSITVLGAITDDSAQEIRMVRVDPTTGRILASATGVGGSGIETINNDANTAQILQVGTAGSDFAIDDVGGGTHTFNLPNASIVARGVVSTGAQSFGGVKTFDSIPLIPSTPPTLANQVVNKDYVDTVAQGLTVKESCRVATTTAGTLATDFENGDTIDGVVLATNDRILIKDQADQTENGIYTVNASGAPTRATDYNQSAEVGAGTFTAILFGTANAGTLWVQTTQNPTLGSSNLVFTQLAGVTAGIGGTSGATNNALIRADGTGGNTVKTSTVIADDSGNLTGLGTLNTHTIQAGTSTFALYSNKLSVFAETTSAELATVISDETGTGVLVFGTAPTFTTSITTPSVLATANDSGAIGASGTAFSDLFLASGGVINWNAGNATLTHSAGLLTSNVSLSLGTSNVLTTGTIELGHATQNTLSASAGVLSIEGVVIPTVSSTNALTNKAITQRVVTTTDDATAVIDVAVTDVYELSAIANNTTFSFTGSPTDGQKFIIRYKDAGVSKTLTWTGFTAIGITLPTATTAGKWGYVGVIYNSAASQYHAVSTVTQS